MVHSWDTVLVVAKIVDNESGQVHFLDPGAFVQNERWSKHADMCVQYAQCIKNIILQDLNGKYTFLFFFHLRLRCVSVRFQLKAFLKILISRYQRKRQKTFQLTYPFIWMYGVL